MASGLIPIPLCQVIESLCKQYGAHILISEFTFRALKATYRTRQLDKVIVKGKATPAAIFEVIDFHDAESFPNQIEVLSHFNNGIEYYNSAAWDKAIECFELALKSNPHDKPSQVYIERCNELKANPPGSEWNGVWVMTHK
jgi:adenylate cyclase